MFCCDIGKIIFQLSSLCPRTIRKLEHVNHFKLSMRSTLCRRKLVAAQTDDFVNSELQIKGVEDILRITFLLSQH